MTTTLRCMAMAAVFLLLASVWGHATGLTKIDREIATYAGILGANRLADDAKDAGGLVLLGLSGKLRPTQDAYLLTVARLEKGLPVDRTKTKVSEKKLLSVISSRAATLLGAVEQGDTAVGQLALLYYRTIEHFQPANDRALLGIMKLKVKGVEGDLASLLDAGIDVPEPREVAVVAGPDQAQADPEKADRFFEQARAAQTRGDEEAAQRLWQQFLQAEPDGERAIAARNGWVILASESYCERPDKEWPHPVWSPDGKRVLFSTGKGGYVARRGSKPASVHGVETGVRFCSWHPEGRLVVGTKRAGEIWTLLFYAVDGDSRVAAVTERPSVYASSACFHPDGTRLLAALTKGNAQAPAHRMAWVTVDSAAMTVVPRPHPTGFWQEDQINLGPNGQTVVFRAQRTTNPTDSPLFAASVGEGASATRLTTGNGCNQFPSVSPDGRSALYHSSDRIGEVRVVSLVDPTQGMKLLDGVTPAWSPDGTAFVFSASTHLMLARVGGVSTAPAAFATRRSGQKLAVAIKNRTSHSHTFTVTYELFDPDSFRIDTGMVGSGRLRLSNGAVTRQTVKLRTPPGKRGDFTLKLTAVTGDGQRAVKLVDVPLR